MNWRGLASLLGTSLLVTGLGGFALLMAAPLLPADLVQPVAATVLREVPRAPDLDPALATTTTTLQDTRGAITRLAISSIELDTRVVPAQIVEHDGAITWDVPKFVAGHAEGTAGAGEPGTSVLIGHVTSLTLGNVFEHLDRVKPGALVRVWTAQRTYHYRVTDVRNVPRTDLAVLEAAATPTLSIITCSGVWLPTIWDFTERLVVRAELAGLDGGPDE
jgi:LPXTG-site transpeptidase (sortase) family protein